MFDHAVRITSSAPAEQPSAGEGTYTTLAPSEADTEATETDQAVLYEGRCELQDTLTSIDRSRLGDVDTEHMLKVYLPARASRRLLSARSVEAGDQVEACFQGRLEDASQLLAGRVERFGITDGVLYFRLAPKS